MDLQLQNKTALVTGSTAGIGLAIAEAIAREGASVVINGRTEQRVGEAVSYLRKSFPASQVRGVAADLSGEAGYQALAKALPEAEILVNNLGICQAKSFEQISDEDWRNILEVNLMSGVRLSRLYLPRMRQRNWGRI